MELPSPERNNITNLFEELKCFFLVFHFDSPFARHKAHPDRIAGRRSLMHEGVELKVDELLVLDELRRDEVGQIQT